MKRRCTVFLMTLTILLVWFASSIAMVEWNVANTLSLKEKPLGGRSCRNCFAHDLFQVGSPAEEVPPKVMHVLHERPLFLWLFPTTCIHIAMPTEPGRSQ